jgi:hypothetical protein
LLFVKVDAKCTFLKAFPIDNDCPFSTVSLPTALEQSNNSPGALYDQNKTKASVHQLLNDKQHFGTAHEICFTIKAEMRAIVQRK